MLPDGFSWTKIGENAKIGKLKCDILGDFQTLWVSLMLLNGRLKKWHYSFYIVTLTWEERSQDFSLKMSRETFTLLKSNSANNLQQCRNSPSDNKNNKRPSVRTRPSQGSLKARNETNRPSTSHIVRKNSSRNKGRKSVKLSSRTKNNKKGQIKAGPFLTD